MRTGDKCERTGVYQPHCCGAEKTVPAGAIFPNCPGCGGPVTWSMIRAVKNEAA